MKPSKLNPIGMSKSVKSAINAAINAAIAQGKQSSKTRLNDWRQLASVHRRRRPPPRPSPPHHCIERHKEVKEAALGWRERTEKKTTTTTTTKKVKAKEKQKGR